MLVVKWDVLQERVYTGTTTWKNNLEISLKIANVQMQSLRPSTCKYMVQGNSPIDTHGDSTAFTAAMFIRGKKKSEKMLSYSGYKWW